MGFSKAVAFILLLALAAALGACANSSAGIGNPPEPAAAAPLPAGGELPFDLPGPEALRHTAYAENTLCHQGLDYVKTLPAYHIEPCGYPADVPPYPGTFYANAAFAPVKTGGRLNFEDMAFAYYQFNVAGYDRDENIRLLTGSDQAEFKVWVGLPDYSRGVWSWRKLPADGIVPVDLAAYSEPDGTMIVAVVALEVFFLEAIRIGAESAPVISSVTPPAAVAGVPFTVYIDADHTWPVHVGCSFYLAGEYCDSYSNMFSYADPSKFTFQLDEPGEYQCTLYLWNHLGLDTREFALSVAPPG